MNEATQIELKKIVERAVRPVRASYDRKRRMREDLLAHVTAVFEDETRSSDDEAAALRRTTDRFGDARRLAEELQASVPRWAFWPVLIDEMVMRQRAGESTFRRALRLSATFFVFNAACAGLVLGVALPILLFRDMPDRWTLGAILLLKMNLGFTSAVFAFSCILPKMRSAIDEPSPQNVRSSWIAAAIGALVVPAIALALYGSFGLQPGDVLRLWLRAIPIGLLTPLGLYFLAWAMARESAFRQEWEGLEIE